MSDDQPAAGASGAKAQDRLLGLLAAVLVVGVVLGIWSWWRFHEVARAPSVSVVTSGRAGVGGAEEPRLQVGTGSHHLSGYVIDSAGSPVVGVEVSARLERSTAPSSTAPSSTAPSSTAPSSTAPSSTAEPAIALSAGTGADGHFELRGAEAGRYRVRVSGGGIFTAELPAVQIPGDELPIVVARKVSISGIVTERGQPVVGATVDVSSDVIGGTVELTSGPGGSFSLPVLPEGAYDLSAYRNDLASPTLHLERLGAGPFAAVELKLDDAAVVVGRVFERGGADGLATGAATGAATGVVAALELRPISDDEPARYLQSGADGRFRAEGVHLGRWVVSAIAPGFVTPDPVEIDAGRGVVEIGVIAGGSIEGRVLDSGGKPIVGAELRASQPGSGLELSGDRDQAVLAHLGGRAMVAASAWDAGAAARQDPRFVPRGELGVLLGPLPLIPPPGARLARHSALDPAELPPELASLRRPPTFAVPPSLASQWTTDEQGRFRLRGVPPGRYTLIARMPGFAEGRRGGVSVLAGAVTRDSDVVLSVGTFVVGSVRSQRGDPVPGARLLATGEPSSPVETLSNGDGSYRLGPLVGTAQVLVTAPGHASAQRRVELGTVAGSVAVEHREEFSLLVYDAVVRGVVDDARGQPVGGARIAIAQGPAQGRTTSSAADGSFSIAQLPEGSLQLTVEHPELPRYQTTVNPASPARLVVPLGGGIEGLLLDDAGKPLTGVRVVASGPGSIAAEAATARDGTWRLAALRPGAWQLAVTRPGFLPATRAVTVPAGQVRGQVTVRDVTLTLARGALAAGTVRDRRGGRLADIRVVARGPGGLSVEARSDAHGEFSLRDCPTGDVEVSAERDGARATTTVFLRPGQEVLSLGLELPIP